MSKNIKEKFDKTKPYVILCEGADEKNFLITYLEYLKTHETIFEDCYYVMDLGGVGDFGRKLATIQSVAGYDYVKSFLLVRDAEKNARSAVDSLIYHINRTWSVKIEDNGDFVKNPWDVKIGFFLFPGVSDSGQFRNGTLEDLCWKIVDFAENISTQELKDYAKKYLNNLVDIRGEMKKPHKNILYILLSSTDKFVAQKIGEAARSGAFDFSSKYLVRLKEMILQMQDG